MSQKELILLKSVLVDGDGIAISKELAKTYEYHYLAGIRNDQHLRLYASSSDIKDITSKLTGRINSDTIININVHGSLSHGEHYFKLHRYSTQQLTSKLLSALQQESEEPLQIHLYSCYSGNADNLIQHLKAGSILTTSSKENYSSFNVLDQKAQAFTLQSSDSNNNPYVHFLNSLHMEAAHYGKFITNNGIYSLNPPYATLLSANNARTFLEQKAMEFIEFSKFQTWSSRLVNLSERTFSDSDINTFSNDYFFCCCAIGEAEFIQFIKEHIDNNEYLSSFIHHSQGDGTNPLSMASYRGDHELARIFINKGADIENPNNKDETSLHIASRFGHYELAKLLIEMGADVDRDVEGSTPLYLAFKGEGERQADKVLELAFKGDTSGLVAYIAEAKKNNLSVFQLLIENNATLYAGFPLISNKFNHEALASKKVGTLEEASLINNKFSLAALESSKVRSASEAARCINNEFSLKALESSKVKSASEAAVTIKNEFNLKALDSDKVTDVYEASHIDNEFKLEALESDKVKNSYEASRIDSEIKLKALKSDKIKNSYEASEIDNEFKLKALGSDKIKYANESSCIDNEFSLQALNSDKIKHPCDAKQIDTEVKLKELLSSNSIIENAKNDYNKNDIPSSLISEETENSHNAEL